MEQTGRLHGDQYLALIASTCLRVVALVPAPALVAGHDDEPAVVAEGVATAAH